VDRADGPVADPGATPPPDDLNLKQAARLLGVHYMTVYRYVRNGLLPARRHGQIWLVDPIDLEDFRLRRRPPSPQRSVDWEDRLLRRLLDGDEVGAWTAITDALSAGRSPQSCHLDLLAPAVAAVEAEVVAGRRTAADACIATTTASRLVARLGAKFRRRGRSRGTVVFGAPPGEHDGLSVAIVANLVRLDGVGVLELGTDTPPATFLEAALRAPDLIAMAIGFSTGRCLPAVIEVVGTIRAVHPDLPVLVNGPARYDSALLRFAGPTAWSSEGTAAVRAISQWAFSSTHHTTTARKRPLGYPGELDGD
jgi:excisionase family DNA binding protein